MTEDSQQDRHLHAVEEVAVAPKDAPVPLEAVLTQESDEVETSQEEALTSEEQAEQLAWWIADIANPAIRENVSNPAWRVASPDSAAWTEERYYEIFARMKVNDLQAEGTIKMLEHEIARVKERNEERNKPFVQALNWWGFHLMDYALKLREQDDSVKSWKGLYLTISTRANSANFEITDKTAFTKWLLANDKTDWYETEIKPKKAAIKKDVVYTDVGNGDYKVIDTKTGTFIDGLTGEPAKITAKIEVEEEDDAKGNPVLHPVRQLYVLEQGN